MTCAKKWFGKISVMSAFLRGASQIAALQQHLYLYYTEGYILDIIDLYILVIIVNIDRISSSCGKTFNILISSMPIKVHDEHVFRPPIHIWYAILVNKTIKIDHWKVYKNIWSSNIHLFIFTCCIFLLERYLMLCINAFLVILSWYSICRETCNRHFEK
jgi:hypothetical protein